MFYKYFLSACVLFFHFINGVFQGADVLHFDEVILSVIIIIIIICTFRVPRNPDLTQNHADFFIGLLLEVSSL